MSENDEQLKTLISFKTTPSRIKFWRDVWHLFLILFFMMLGFGLLALGQWRVCVSRWPEKSFNQCMRYEVEPRRIRK